MGDAMYVMRLCSDAIRCDAMRDGTVQCDMAWEGMGQYYTMCDDTTAEYYRSMRRDTGRYDRIWDQKTRHGTLRSDPRRCETIRDERCNVMHSAARKSKTTQENTKKREITQSKVRRGKRRKTA